MRFNGEVQEDRRNECRSGAGGGFWGWERVRGSKVRVGGRSGEGRVAGRFGEQVVDLGSDLLEVRSGQTGVFGLQPSEHFFVD